MSVRADQEVRIDSNTILYSERHQKPQWRSGSSREADKGRSVRSSSVYCSSDLPGLPARDPARAFTVDLLTAQPEIRIHRALVFPLHQVSLQVKRL